MEDQDRAGEKSESQGETKQDQQTSNSWPESGSPEGLLALPDQSPLFHAEHASRYERQRLIQLYEDSFDCQLIVMIDAIFPDGIILLEELLYNLEPGRPLHMILDSPGGDGETAVRMVRAAQARCSELTVIVPDQAKSAATILAMGAHQIVMGPTSDLGPVDPQFPISNLGLVSAKVIIAAMEKAEASIQETPETYPLHATMLEAVDSLVVETARSALARTRSRRPKEQPRSQRGRCNQPCQCGSRTAHRPTTAACSNSRHCGRDKDGAPCRSRGPEVRAVAHRVEALRSLQGGCSWVTLASPCV